MSDTLRNVKIKYGVDLSQYTTATTKLKQEQTKIETAFRESANAMDDWKGKSDGLALRVSSLSEKIKLQKDVLANLKAQYDAVSTAAGEDSAAAVKLKGQYNAASVTLDKMNSDLSSYRDKLYQAATAEGKTASEAKAMGGQIQTASTKTSTFKDKIKDFAKSSVGQFASVAGAVALAVKAVTALWDVFNNSANWADDLKTLSTQTSIATGELQAMEYASRFVDVEMSDLERGLAKVITAYKEAKGAGRDYIEIADGLTISTHDASGAVKDSQELFYDAIDAIGTLANETDREAASQDLFGKSYQDLMPLISAGSDALKKYGDEAKDSGIIISDGMVDALAALDDKMERSSAKTESNGLRMAAVMSDVGSTMNDAKYYAENLATVLSYKVWRGVSQWLSDASDATMDMYETLKVGADAAGTDIDDFSQKVTDMTGVILVASGGAKTWDEAYAEATSNVIQNIDETKWANDQMVAAQAAANESINAAADAYVAKWTEYQQAVKSSAADYASDLGGLFEAFDAELAGTQEALDEQSTKLLDNLQSQVDGIEGWSTEMAALAKRGIDQGLLQELRDMGPEAYSQIKALNNMTDSQLQEYSGLYRKMGSEVTSAAEDANKDLARETEKALQTANIQANNQTVKMKALGVNLAKGLAKGFDDTSPYVTSKLQDVIDDAIEAAKKKNGIRSPSKVTAELLGEPLGAGVGVGWADSIKDISPKIEAAMRSVTSELAASAYQMTASPSSYVSSAASAGSVSTTNNTQSVGSLISIGQYIQNTDDDVNALGYKLALAQRRAAAAIGG